MIKILNNLDHLPCNTDAIIQFNNVISTDDKPSRVKTKIVGVHSGSSVMIAWENTKSWAVNKDSMRESEQVILRILNTHDPKGKIFAFKTFIKKVISNPSKIIFLQYPKAEDIEFINLRQDARIKVDVNATIINPANNQVVYKGCILDVSKNGCGFQIEHLKTNDIDMESTYNLEINYGEKNYSTKILIKKHDDRFLGIMFAGDTANIKEFVSGLSQIYMNQELFE